MWIRVTIQQLIKNSVHVGHDFRITLRSNSWFFKGRRQNIYIIDVVFTINMFRLIYFAYHKILSNRGVILFVNNMTVMADLVELWAKKSTQPFSNLKWYVGALTNIKSFFSLLEYIKISKRKEKRYMYNTYGLMRMRRLPNALFLTSLGISIGAKSEGMLLKLPIVGVIDTNISSFGITMPIPGNDQSIDALNFYHSYISKIIILGKYISLLKFKHLILNKDLGKKLLEEDINWWKSRFEEETLLIYKFRYIKLQENWRRWKKKKRFNLGMITRYKMILAAKLKKKLMRKKLQWMFFKERLEKEAAQKDETFDDKAPWEMLKDLEYEKRFRIEENFISESDSQELDSLLQYKAFRDMMRNSLKRFREYKLAFNKDKMRLLNLYINFFVKYKYNKIENKNIYRKHNRIVIYKYNEVNFVEK